MAAKMEHSKVLVQSNFSPHDVEITGPEAVVAEKKGTGEDQWHMWRMGKLQEMRRNFRFISIFGFSMILMATWETALGAPTSGGQYHWVSEFAPKQYQKFLSYMIGWLCVLGWQTSAAATSFLAGTQIQGLLVLNYPDYVFERYQGTLLVFAISGFSVFFNTYLAKRLPLIEAIVLVVHVFGFFAILIPLWVLGPRSSAKEVFTQFNNGGGWANYGTSALVGILASILPLLCADAAVHMSKELRDASKVLPRCMIWTTVFDGLLGFVMIITFCFRLGDLETAIQTPTGYAFIQVFYGATRSHAGATVMSALIIVMAAFCNLSIVATASRQLFAFARDQGVPFAEWLAFVRPGWDVPVNAVMVSFAVSCLLALINTGSTVAFNSISSLALCALLSSYIVSISCLLQKRWRNEPLLKSHFSLGKYGFAINIISLIFLVFAFVLSFFPLEPNPTLQLMNWNILIYGVVVMFSLIYFWWKGRHVYAGPVEYVRKGE